jgi:hypothetical protein
MTGDEHIEFAVQAYADDVVFISQEPEGRQDMLSTLEHFVEWSRSQMHIDTRIEVQRKRYPKFDDVRLTELSWDSNIGYER